MGQWLQPKLQLRVAQKQILTPGLVQMVSVLALNRLELREMVTAEMVANPMLEEVTEENLRADSYTNEAFVKAESEVPSEGEKTNPFDEFDVAGQLAAERGWMVPAYTLPPNAEHVRIMRALVKLTLGHSLVTALAHDIGEACVTLRAKGGLHPTERARVHTNPHF